MSNPQVEELLKLQTRLMDCIKDRQAEDFSEDDAKIEQLTSKIVSAKQSLQAGKQILESKTDELHKHLDSIKKLETEENKVLEEIESLEAKRNKFKISKPNSKDQELIDIGRRKYALYKDLTRIRWDYEKLKENIQGYVSNKKDYIRHFSYKCDDENLVDNLWQEIHQSTIHMDNVGVKIE